MEELEKQKEKLNQRIQDLQGEIEMGQICRDQEMIDDAKKEIEEVKKEIQQIEDKIVREQNKEVMRKEFDEKFPEQYLYERIISMCDEELIQHSEKQLKENKALYETKQKEYSEIIEKMDDLSRSLVSIGRRIEDVKKMYKESHLPELIDEAKERVARIDEINKELKELEQSKEDKKDEWKKVGPLEMTPEEVRQGMIAQLEGKYKTKFVLSEYIKSFQDKPLSDLLEDLNEGTIKQQKDYVKKKFVTSEEYQMYRRITAKNAERLLPRPNQMDCSLEGYDRVKELINFYNTECDNVNIKVDVRNACMSLVKDLEEVKKLFESILPEMKSYAEMREKLLKGYERGNEYLKKFQKVESILKSKAENELSSIMLSIEANKRIINICIAYEIGNAIDDEEKFDEVQKKEFINVIKEDEKNYPLYMKSYVNYKKTDAKFKILHATHNKLQEELSAIGKKYGNIFYNGRKAEEEVKKIDFDEKIMEMSEFTSSKPGQYTFDDIEKYTIMEEIAEEVKEAAIADSQIEKNKYEEAKPSQETQEEIEAMLEHDYLLRDDSYHPPLSDGDYLTDEDYEHDKHVK